MAKDIRFRFDYPSTPGNDNLSKTLGHAIRVLGSSSDKSISLSLTLQALWPAVRLNQIIILYNTHGAPVAYATWMHLSAEMSAYYTSDSTFPIDLSDRNEGDVLWITNIVAPFGDLKPLIRKVRAALLPDGGTVRAHHLKGARPSKFSQLRFKPTSLHINQPEDRASLRRNPTDTGGLATQGMA